MACGEGYGSEVLARDAPRRRSASTPTPRPTSTRACATARANLRFERELVETLRRAGRRGRVPADDRARAGPRRGARALPLARRARRRRVYVSTPNVLTLAPEGAERSGNPWHVHEYRARGVRELCARALRAGRAVRAVPRAQAARARARAARSAGTACTRALGLTERVLRPLHAGDRARATSRCARAARPISTARWTSWPSAGREPRTAAARGELAIVLHTHMPYVEGFGTWPFGEEWLWEAIAGCYLPLLDAARRAARR